MNEKELLDKIAKMVREAYPEAVAVTVFVNNQESSIEKQYRQKLDGISMKQLNGDWVKEAAQ